MQRSQMRSSGISGAGEGSAESRSSVFSRAPRFACAALSRSNEPGPSIGSYEEGVHWIRSGLSRQRAAVAAALVLSWTGMWMIPWGAAFGSIVGALGSVGLIAMWTSVHHIDWAGSGQAVTIFGFFSGLVLGFVAGGLLLLASLVSHLTSAIVSLACGVVAAAVVVAYSASFERVALRLRGYRRLSRQEVRRIAPLVKGVADAMALDGLPRFAIADNLAPNAWTHMRTIVLTTGLLHMLDDDELTAVLAHELHHWSFGDAVGLRMVWAAALPLAILLNVGAWIGGGSSRAMRGSGGQTTLTPVQSRSRGLLSAIGWLVAWAPWMITKFVLVPIAARAQRESEYGADGAAAALGYASSLSSALRKLGAFETGRTGWERTLSATHPPTELRIEALESPKDDDDMYQESELGFQSVRDFFGVLRLFA